jgi:alkylhydroperoxidase family enzyme
MNALAKFSLAIHEKRGFVSDADVAAFKTAGYGEAHIAEVVANYALAVYTNYFNHVNLTAVDFPAASKI